MHNYLYLTQNYLECQDEQIDDFGNIALDNLRQKLQTADSIQNNKHLKNQQQYFIASNQQQSNSTYTIYSSHKQPTSYSLYRKQVKQYDSKTKQFNIFSNQTIESVKDCLSFQYSKILYTQPIKQQSRSLNQRNSQQNSNIQLFKSLKSINFMDNNMESNDKQLNVTKQEFSFKISKKPIKIVHITQNSQAVKNLQRKLKNSRRDIIQKLNQSNSINQRELNFGFDFDEQSRTIKTQSTYTNSWY